MPPNDEKPAAFGNNVLKCGSGRGLVKMRLVCADSVTSPAVPSSNDQDAEPLQPDLRTVSIYYAAMSKVSLYVLAAVIAAAPRLAAAQTPTLPYDHIHLNVPDPAAASA